MSMLQTGCSQAQEIDTYIDHITSLVDYLHDTYSEDEEEEVINPRAEIRTHFLIELLDVCITESRELLVVSLLSSVIEIDDIEILMSMLCQYAKPRYINISRYL